ncbi:MAG: tetratricopeptide repeat protein [Reyranellaceae bacterium]
MSFFGREHRVGALRVRLDAVGSGSAAAKLFRTLVSATAFAAAGHLGCQGAYADGVRTGEEPAISRRYAAYDAALQQSLLKPADPKTLATFATIAVEIGDLEGAISALERLLLISGDLPDVKLELGVLYFRLGSFETARAYLRSAITSPKATAYVRDRANQYLKMKTKT